MEVPVCREVSLNTIHASGIIDLALKTIICNVPLSPFRDELRLHSVADILLLQLRPFTAFSVQLGQRTDNFQMVVFSQAGYETNIEEVQSPSCLYQQPKC